MKTQCVCFIFYYFYSLTVVCALLSRWLVSTVELFACQKR